MKPIRFTPLYQTRVWGGRSLETSLHRTLPDSRPYGESWEMCDRQDAQTVAQGGAFHGMTLHEMWSAHRETIFGKKHSVHPAERFPILLKILDCQDVLSVQVHPPANLAPSLNAEPKTEMWFVADAAPDATIYAGLRRGATRHEFESALTRGAVADLLHVSRPTAGDAYFLPSGRVHALGAGLLIFEIQQNSDTTYRVFDWNRTGLDGKPRDLHVAESLQCIDFNDHEPSPQLPNAQGMLASCPYFQVRHHELAPLSRTGNLTQADDFAIIAIVKGHGTLGEESVTKGDFVLLPASTETMALLAGADGLAWLQIALPSALSAAA